MRTLRNCCSQCTSRPCALDKWRGQATYSRGPRNQVRIGACSSHPSFLSAMFGPRPHAQAGVWEVIWHMSLMLTPQCQSPVSPGSGHLPAKYTFHHSINTCVSKGASSLARNLCFRIICLAAYSPQILLSIPQVQMRAFGSSLKFFSHQGPIYPHLTE